jgi:serine/threonine-protein kinase
MPRMKLRLPFRYELAKVLGRGGMGVVIAARDRKLGRDVAIKVIRGRQGVEAAMMARFAREALVMSEVEHPNLIHLLDVDLEHDPPILVMDLVQGGSLGELITGETPGSFGSLLRPAQVIRLGKEVGGALHELHSRGVLHRDLKPDNIMIRDHTGEAILMDLGLAKSEEATVLTRTGALLGTPLYLPTEVVRGREWTPAGDQFQLAAVMRLALTGTRHIVAGDLGSLIPLLQKGEWEPFPEQDPPPPPALVAVIQRAMDPDPESRYEDMLAFIAALEEPGVEGTVTEVQEAAPAWARAPTSSPPPSSPSTPTPRSSSRPTWLALPLLAAAIATGLAVSPDAPALPANPTKPSGSVPDAFEDRARLGPGDTVLLEARHPCVAWWGSDPGQRHLFLPGRVTLPIPTAPSPWKLRWQSMDGTGTRELPWRDVAEQTARYLVTTTGQEDPGPSIIQWRPDPERASTGPWEEVRHTWIPLAEQVPALLTSDLDPALRGDLWTAWQRVLRSGDQVTSRGGSPTLVAPPAGTFGDPELGAIPEEIPRVMVELERFPEPFVDDRGRRGQALILPGWTRHTEVYELRFDWPELPASRSGWRPTSRSSSWWSALRPRGRARST